MKDPAPAPSAYVIMVLVGTEHPHRTSTFHPRNGIVAVLLLLAACCPPCFALNPSLEISQYAHTAWPLREGHYRGVIYSIAQTDDGYLWLGTEFRLVRFDGVRFNEWQPPHDQRLPSTRISKLLAARDGTLWIGTARGLASWKDGKLSVHTEFAGQGVDSLRQATDGVIWAGASGASGLSTARLCAIRNGGDQCYGQDGVFGSFVRSLYTAHGEVWVLAQSGLWRWTLGL